MSTNTILASAPLTATGYHLKATGTALGQSLIWDNGTNVGIGNQGTTYTLDVSGTGRFTGIVTFGSTLSNGTYAYTLPSATGTLALTSAIPANPVGGTGTTNTIPKFTASSTLGDSAITDNGTTVTLVSRALSGTSATFTSTITSNNAIGVEKNGSGTFGGGGRFYLYNAATTDGFLMQLNASNNIDYWGVTSNTPTASPVITFTRAGAATFSSSVTAGSEFISYSGITMDAGGGTIRGGLTINYSTGEFKSFCGVSGNSYFQTFNTNGSERMRITSGGNVLIGTTTDSSYKLAVASGTQYLGAGFVVSNDFTSTIRQGASGVADFSGTTVTFDLASIFPRLTFTNRGLSVTLQLVAVPTYTITSSAFVVLGRTGNSNVWSNAILANININGVAVNSVSASGTVITVVYSTQISGTAYINVATIG